MTPEKVKEVAWLYRDQLSRGGYEPAAHPLNRHCSSTTDALRHCAYACRRIIEFVDAGRIEKAMRWLGFVQGVFWAFEWSTIDDLANDNRPPDVVVSPDQQDV